jgi:DNA polymerase III epsilon subunit-like protein
MKMSLIQKNRVLVFDTETTGLFPKKNESNAAGPLPSYKEYPYILQLSFVVFDVSTNEIRQKYNEYIKIPSNIEIKPFITNLTGITREICDTKGIPIEQALYDFYLAYMSVDFVIAHNISFDKRMIELEIQRNASKFGSSIPSIYFLFNETFNIVYDIMMVCTMNMGKNVCNIMIEGKNGAQWKKPPKLLELHKVLFGSVPENLHNSLIDTMVCLRCFIKIKYNVELPESMILL